MPSVFGVCPDFGVVLTTFTFTRNSILSPITWTSSALEDISPAFTASLGPPDDAICAVELPLRLLTSQVPPCSTMKYFFFLFDPPTSNTPTIPPQYSLWP